MKPKNHSFLALTAFAGLALVLSAGSAQAVISLVNTGTSVLVDGGTVLETTPQTIAFDAGATSDALIVQLSSETLAPAATVTLTYAGFSLTPVLDFDGAGSGKPSLWYLNLGSTGYSGGVANLVLDMSSGGFLTNGYGMGIISVNAGGMGIQVHTSGYQAVSYPIGVEITEQPTVGITTTVESFVVAGHRLNREIAGAGTANSPLTQVYSEFIGSSHGAAGYEAGVAPGTHSYGFTIDPLTPPRTQGSQMFVAAFTPVPEPSSAATFAGLAALGLLVRRRK